jgi:membrane protease YdiL (CAAX protease family)
VNRGKYAISIAVFISFFIVSYVFILSNIDSLNYAAIGLGLISIPVSLLLFRKYVIIDFRSSVLQLAVLASAFLLLIFFFSITDLSWARVIPYILISPVLIEEFNFRYLLQHILMRKQKWYSSVIIQALVYSVFYSKYVVANHGAGFPFPYNILMLTSVFGMGVVYGLLSKVSRNFILPTTVHLVIWSLFPVIAIYAPGIASTLIPT